jgi:hypothetical protein
MPRWVLIDHSEAKEQVEPASPLNWRECRSKLASWIVGEREKKREREKERERETATGCYVQDCFVTSDRRTDRLGAPLAFVGRSLLWRYISKPLQRICMTFHFYRQNTYNTVDFAIWKRNIHVRGISFPFFSPQLSYFVSGIQILLKTYLFVCVLSLFDYAKPFASRHIKNLWLSVLRINNNQKWTSESVRGRIQNIPDWRCKNHETHHKAYRPPSPSK